MNLSEVSLHARRAIKLEEKLVSLYTNAEAILFRGEEDRRIRSERTRPFVFNLRFHQRQTERLRHVHKLPVVYAIAREQLHNDRWIPDELVPEKEVKIWPPTILGEVVISSLKETSVPDMAK